MSKQILFGQEAREKLLEGSELLAKAVSSSLGPRGNNTGIDRGFDTLIVHDGVTIAQAVESDDKAVNFAIRVIRESANKQVAMVGDGTTVVTILANAIFKECFRSIGSGTNAMSLRKGLEEGRNVLLDSLRTLSTPIKTIGEAVRIATISAEDDQLGHDIGELVFKLGTQGVITVEESKSPVTTIDMQEGMQFDKGYLSPYFITDPIRAEATIEDTFVFITDKIVNNINELLPLFQKMEAEKVPMNITLIAPEVTDSALASLLLNKMRGALNVLCVQAPYSGQLQKDMLTDIAVTTGATLISSDQGQNFTNVELTDLGQAERITATKDATLIVGGKGEKKAIDERIATLKALIERDEAVSDFQREKLRERIAKLTNGIAVINVGGATEIEIKERLERAKDAVAATQAALSEGIVPGGEVIYLRLREALDKTDLSHKILYNALEQPFAKLLSNAGLKPDSYIGQLTGNYGVDVVNGYKRDMVKSGIIDPSMVAREAITNSVSTAIQLMSTEVLIVDKLNEQPAK